MKVTTIIGLVMTIIGFLFMCIILGTESWGMGDSDGDTTYGLFKMCTKHWESYQWDSECKTYSEIYDGAEYENEGTLDATKACLILAIVASVVGVVVIVLFIFMENKINGKLAAIPLLLAALFQLIAMCIYAGDADDNARFGWGYGLGWATFFYPFVAAVAMILDQ